MTDCAELTLETFQKFHESLINERPKVLFCDNCKNMSLSLDFMFNLCEDCFSKLKPKVGSAPVSNAYFEVKNDDK